MISNFISRLILTLNLLFLTSVAFAQNKAIDTSAAYWKDYIVGTIDQIPNPKIKKYLLDTHHNNDYGKTIAKSNNVVGVFSPSLDNVFWLPTIDLPVDESQFRFLSASKDIPKDLKKNIFYKKGGQYYLRMFIHPFSTLRAHFIELAEKNGGFRYEYQAATTASVRSFVVWKTKSSGLKPTAGVDFPDNVEQIFKAKVSIYNVDIDGSRRNPAKKMVRAAAVSRIFGAISNKNKLENGFDFEREVMTAVPIDTDAGFVVREGLAVLRDLNNPNHSEPAFSALSSSRLKKLTKGQKDPLGWVVKNLFNPIAKSIVYLLMQEGLIGENHLQNFDYEMDSKDRPTGKVILRDADAFRVNNTLRALNNRNIDVISDIENPFYYLKEAVFSSVQNSEESVTTLKGLLDYLLHPYDDSSFTTAVYNWCKGVVSYKAWCKKSKILNSLTENMAAMFSLELGRDVTSRELYKHNEDSSANGLAGIFKERLNKLKLASSKPIIEADQAKLHDYVQKMVKRGFVRFSPGSKTLSKTTNTYALINENGNSHIRVYKKDTREGRNPLVAIALLDRRDIALTTDLLKSLKQKAHAGKCRELLSDDSEPVPLPIMQNLGGGNNVR
jgi:hypothetical protein